MSELCICTLPLSLAVTFTSNCNERLMTLRTELALTTPANTNALLRHEIYVISTIMESNTVENEYTPQIKHSTLINRHFAVLKYRNINLAICKDKACKYQNVFALMKCWFWGCKSCYLTEYNYLMLKLVKAYAEDWSKSPGLCWENLQYHSYSYSGRDLECKTTTAKG